MRLVTIGFSHFCEKARWGLDHAGLAYEEEAHAPLLAWAAALSASGQRQVPILVPEDGRAVVGSSAILRWADAHATSGAPKLWPSDLDETLTRYVADLDRTLGPAARRVAYYQLLPDHDLMRHVLARSARSWERSVTAAGHRAMAKAIRRGLRIDDAGYARSMAALERAFADAGARLEQTGRLVGDVFTAADVTFASLAGPVLFTPAVEERLCPYARLPASARELFERLRATRAGAYAMSLYEDERPRSCGTSR